MIGSLNTNAREVTIVGAGIAGMLAGYNLDQQGYRVTLLEEKERAGGLIQTSATPFGIAESAAHSLVVTGAVLNLCQELGVELIEPRKEARAKYIVRNGKLCRFPLGIGEAAAALARAALVCSDASGAPQTLDAWAHRHLGDPALQYLLTPFVRGIYGVQPAELGVAAAFPFLKVPPGKTLAGSMLGRRRNGRAKKAKHFRATPKFGMGDLVARLEKQLEERLGSRFRKGERINTVPTTANVIIATPAHAAAQLLAEISPSLSARLREVKYTPIVSVTVFVKRASFTRPVEGVGVLMPACEQRESLGILFNSSSFACRVTDEARYASFTVMMGGTSQSELLSATDEEIDRTIRNELSAVLGIRGEPPKLVVHRWPRALPQYSVELPNVWQEARETWCATPGHLLFGNYTGQISLRGMIESAGGLV